LSLENVNLKNISSEAITHLVQRLLKKEKNKAVRKAPFVFFKEIRAKHIMGTLKPITYGSLKLEGATLLLDNAIVDPYNAYEYKVKALEFTGQTNFGSVDYKGNIEASTIDAKGEIVLDKALFRKYKLPLNFKGLKHLSSSLKLNHSGVWVDIDHRVKNLLKLKHNEFNINITKGKHKLSYIYAKDLIIDSQLKGSISYADETTVDVKTVINFNKGRVSYCGDAKIAKIKNLPPLLSEYLLKGLKGEFSGDIEGLVVDLDTNLLKGRFETSQYKTASLKLESQEKNILLSKIFPDIKPLYGSETIFLESNTFFDFEKSEKSYSNLLFNSNFLNVKAVSNLNLPTKIELLMDVPKTSKLREINPKIKFDTMAHLESDVLIMNNTYKIRVKDMTNNTRVMLDYDFSDNSIKNGKILLGNDEVLFHQRKGEFRLDSHISDVRHFMTYIQEYYQLQPSMVGGALDLSLKKSDSGLVLMHFESDKLAILKDAQKEAIVLNLYNFKSTLEIDNNFNIEMKNYQFHIDENPYLYEFSATRPSFFTYKDSKFTIKELWINDAIRLKGEYRILKELGHFSVDTKAFHLRNKDFYLTFNVDLEVGIRGEKVDVEGDIMLLGESINYELEGSDIVKDADIVIVQEEKEKEESPLKNLKLYIKVHNKKPLHYYGKDADIEFYNELSIVKSYNHDMLITGMSTISKGVYQLEDKQFNLEESHLYFAGDISKPLLDIKANYEKEQYNIHVFISGTTEEPIVNFNSDPYLTQQEILSLILFDGTGSSNGKGAEAYTLLGGTFAKGLMKSLGINVDHFLLGSDENDELSLEVGRKVSKDVTILYLHKNGLDGAKVRLEHSKDFETDIIIQPPNSSSIEFLYKQDR